MTSDSSHLASRSIQLRPCIKCWKWTAREPCDCGGDVQHPEFRSRRTQPNDAEYWYKSFTRGGRRGGRERGLEGVWLDEVENLSKEQIEEMLRSFTDRWRKKWTDPPNQSPRKQQPPIPKK